MTRLSLLVVLACAGGATASCSEEPRGNHYRLDMRDLMFQPHVLQVSPGDTVSWINHDIVSHTVTASDKRWDSGEVLPGATFTMSVGDSDITGYACSYHPSMTGELRPGT